MSSKSKLLTKVQVPRRIIVRNPDKSGVLSGRGSQASSTIEVSVEVA